MPKPSQSTSPCAKYAEALKTIAEMAAYKRIGDTDRTKEGRMVGFCFRLLSSQKSVSTRQAEAEELSTLCDLFNKSSNQGPDVTSAGIGNSY